MFRAKRIVSVILVMAVMCSTLSGCATTRREQEQAKGSAVGAGLGTLIGAGVGYAFGGRDGALIGAGLGAAVGGLAGYTYASRAYDNIEKASNRAAALEQATAQNQRYVDEQGRELAKLTERNKELDRETAALAAEYRNRKVTAEALAGKKAKYDKEVADARTNLDVHQKELAYLEGSALPATQRYGTEEQVSKLKSQIEKVQKQNAEMEKAIEERASCCQRLVSG
jgi:hypothetical protein